MTVAAGQPMSGRADHGGARGDEGPCPSHGVHTYRFAVFSTHKKLQVDTRTAWAIDAFEAKYGSHVLAKCADRRQVLAKKKGAHHGDPRSRGGALAVCRSHQRWRRVGHRRTPRTTTRIRAARPYRAMLAASAHPNVLQPGPRQLA
ncbi:MAG TPA: hypothetical protein VLJ86_08425 [Ramlibacter sp.]|nr:hypothetical protein [Ramlibacter sp.]